MKRITHILLIAILILAGCKDHSSIDPEAGLSENLPIEFGVSGDLSVESKAPITSGADFIAFADLTVGTSAPVSVFGAEGQKVTFADGDYTYSPMRYWQLGSYFFGGVMPEGDFYTASFSAADKQITLDFGEDGYNLAEHQADLMAAFHTVDLESLSNPAPVDFDFDHQLSWVVIEAASLNSGLSDEGVLVSTLKVYGNSPSTQGDIVFTYNGTGVTATGFQNLSEKTTGENPFETFTAPSGAASDHDWKLLKPGTDGAVYDVLVPQLLVFPEECTFTVVVTYTENGIEKTRVGSLAANWVAGKKYTYKLHLATDISFTVSVTGWGTEAVPDTDGDNDVEIY